MKARFIITQLTLQVAIFALLTSLPGSRAFASEDGALTQSTSASLGSLAALYSDRIASVELQIRNETERRTTILDQLDGVINKLSALEHQSDVVVRNSPQLTEHLQQVSVEMETLERDLSRNKNLLEQLQSSLAEQPHLSVWQAALGRPELKARHKLLATQRYLVHTTQQKHEQLQTRKRQLGKRYQSIIDYNQGITDSIDELQNDADTLLQRRAQLEQQLTEISSEIVAKQDRISALTQRSQLLLSNPDALHFGTLKKKLKDPVEGRLIRQFSEPKAKGLLKWKGILVEAPLGLPFTAVSDGLVVFADQLQGLGNVAIVDHGHGYMSLYGMAELLLVQKDQLLLEGDPVGTVGESVGAGTSALYFEVRHNADALDPQNWLEMHQIAQKNTL